MGADQAVNIIHRKELSGKDAEKIRTQKVKEYSEKFLGPEEAASHGKVDAIIQPEETRTMLCKVLEMLLNKREKRPGKKHGNIPL